MEEENQDLLGNKVEESSITEPLQKVENINKQQKQESDPRRSSKVKNRLKHLKNYVT